MLRTNADFLAYIQQLFDAGKDSSQLAKKSFKKGSLIFKQGQSVSKLIVIESGITKCFINEDNDKDYIVELLSRGEMIGEIELIRRIPCLCNIAAITDVSVFALSQIMFSNLMRTDPVFNQFLVDSMATRIVNTSTRASYQQAYTLERNLAKLLQVQEQEGISLSKNDMAAYLGITIRSLNRALKKE